MSTMTADFAALCAAIDQGDDSALPVLADLLEEQIDPRAAGLRRLWAHGKASRPVKSNYTRTLWVWYSDETGHNYLPNAPAEHQIPGVWLPRYSPAWGYHATRSLAFLAASVPNGDL